MQLSLKSSLWAALWASLGLSVATFNVAAQPAPASIAALDPSAIRVVLTSDMETTLVAPAAGRVISVISGVGTVVPRGKTVVAFDCSEHQAKLQMAKAEYAGAKETLDVKTSLRKLDAAGDSEVAVAKASVERAQAAIDFAAVQVGQCTVSAPFSGRVVKTYVKNYQGVNAGSPLVELVSNDALKLRLNVPSKMLRTLKVGTPFEVDIEETGKTYTAKVSAINARVDAVAQTVELEARFATASPALLAGMTGVARFK